MKKQKNSHMNLMNRFFGNKHKTEEASVEKKAGEEKAADLNNAEKSIDYEKVIQHEIDTMEQQIYDEFHIPRGIMRGITGMYAGGEIDLTKGTIIIGRDPQRANLVFGEECPKVSRKHCEIRYDKKEKLFFIKDYSSNGTFKNQSENCLPQNMEISLEAGSILDIGDENNRFILE